MYADNTDNLLRGFHAWVPKLQAVAKKDQKRYNKQTCFIFSDGKLFVLPLFIFSKCWKILMQKC